MRGVKVLKFGGTSMGSAESIARVAHIVREESRSGRARPRAVIVSAMGGVTDALIDIAKRAAARDASYRKALRALEKRHAATTRSLVGPRLRAQSLEQQRALFDSLESVTRGIYLVQELSPGALDFVMSYGERLSAHVLASALHSRGARAECLDAREVVRTDSNFGEAAVRFAETNKRIRAYFKAHPALQVVTGFIGSNAGDATTTLGRGGSDYSASIFGAALGARVIEIWTDVSGVMTADPRKVKDALPVAELSYLEASEMSYFGAKVIHPPTMRPAMEKRIPIHIKNTFEPDAPGTVVGRGSPRSAAILKGITSMSDIAVIQVEGSGLPRVRGASGRLFASLSSAGVNVIMITQASSQHSISIAIVRKDAERACEAIEEEFALERQAKLLGDVSVEEDLSVLAIVGEGMKHRRGIAGKLFSTLGRNGINVVAIAQGSSELNISVVIRKSDSVKALNAVHAAFFAPRQKVFNVFLVGTGVVGGALLRQIAKQEEALARTHGFIVRIAGLADADRMAFDPEGIAARGWKQALAASRTRMDISRFIERMQALSLPGSVFVDCTASEEVAARYLDVLRAGICIVTPNKRANSGRYGYYQALREAAAKYGVQFLYETNVGAGLPVLSTLRDLMLSGDRVHKIEAVLSGTLSYIFDTFTGERPFSEVVREARERGFTEPDPRADLSGTDVARKILILARESGRELELAEVQVESLLNPRTARAGSPEAFFKALQRDDAHFAKKARAAAKSGKVLRYIATLQGGKARVSLRAVGPQHPFYAVYGNDNIIAYFTDRYRTSPLIIQGPGAGADVTAAGVFADILRTAPNGV